MFRIINGQWFQGKVSADRFSVSIHELGNGHTEVSVARCIDWSEDRPLNDAELMRLEQPSDADIQEKREANRRRAARRACSNVRRKCKVAGFDSLLTLTYRANMQDRALLRRHLEAFVRRMRGLIPGFAYVAAFEQQKRGAWHVHMAVHRVASHFMQAGVRVKSFDVIRSVWRSVVGELGGNVDLSRRKRNSRKSPARVAAYLSKYMVKAFEDGDDWSKRYSGSSITLPAPIRLELIAGSLRELVAEVFAFVGHADAVTTFLSPFGDLFYCATDPGGGSLPRGF